MVILRAKCIVAGDANVGKSALVQAFCSDGSQFLKNYSMYRHQLKQIFVSARETLQLMLSSCLYARHEALTLSQTVGVDLHTKIINIPETSDSVELYLYDSSGKEIFVDIVQQSWDAIDMVMVAYDVTCEQSYNACVEWIERCQKKMDKSLIIGVLVANKTDLKQRRVVTLKQGKELAESHKLEYIETSAKQNENVEAAFYYLANSYHKMYKDKLDVMQSLV